jgi:hypothetical protein
MLDVKRWWQASRVDAPGLRPVVGVGAGSFSATPALALCLDGDPDGGRALTRVKRQAEVSNDTIPRSASTPTTSSSRSSTRTRGRSANAPSISFR